MTIQLAQTDLPPFLRIVIALCIKMLPSGLITVDIYYVCIVNLVTVCYQQYLLLLLTLQP